MGCRDTVLPEPLLRNGTINCLIFEQNTKQLYSDKLCLFPALDFHLHRSGQLEEETSKIFKMFINWMDGISPSHFQGVYINNIAVVEDLLTTIILLYDIDILDGNTIGELARRSVLRFETTVRLLRYNNLKCYVSNIYAVFESYHCLKCDNFFNRTFNSERHLTTCSEPVVHVYPRNVNQIRETLFDNLDSFVIRYTGEQKFIKNLAIFDFESICV